MSIQGNPFTIHDSSLVLSLDAANIKSFRGEPTTNYCIRSNNFSTGYSGYWTYPASLATGYSDPFGGNTAWAFPLSDAAGGPNSDSCGLIYGSDSNTNNVTTTTSMWFRSDTNISMGFGKDDGSTVGFTCTPDWQRITVTSLGVNNYGRAMQFMVYRAQNSGVSTSSKIYIYGCQIEVKGYVTPYIYTDGSFGTRGTTVETGGGLYDLTNGNNNGTLTNGPIYTSSFGGSIVFDGTNDYISTPITGTFSQITFDYWGFYDELTLNTRLRNESAFGDWTNGRIHWGTRWSVGMHWNVNNVWTEVGTTNLRYGWNHFSLVWNNNTSQKLIYINNILSSSEATNGNVILGDFRIGVATTLDAYYRGNISNFKVYNRALSASEVLNNYNSIKSRFGL